MIDILATIFVVGVFVNFGYSKYKKKKSGITGCDHCAGCKQLNDCVTKEIK